VFVQLVINYFGEAVLHPLACCGGRGRGQLSPLVTPVQFWGLSGPLKSIVILSGAIRGKTDNPIVGDL